MSFTSSPGSGSAGSRSWRSAWVEPGHTDPQGLGQVPPQGQGGFRGTLSSAHSSWGGSCMSWKRMRPPHWVCNFKRSSAPSRFFSTNSRKEGTACPPEPQRPGGNRSQREVGVGARRGRGPGG
uniref:Uncharacterized protein n=1 Tax=Myotis myotis TaxID=51298 RepID=A0A7J7SR35_MYOMY|nr:hypothetical protein mMyoMyo1_009306 [Myotis myotis]